MGVVQIEDWKMYSTIKDLEFLKEYSKDKAIIRTIDRILNTLEADKNG